MKRLLAAMVVVGAAFVVVPAHAGSADCSAAPATPVGQVCTTDGGGVLLQGASTNPAPFDGYIAVNDGNSSDKVICARGSENYNDPNNDFSCDYGA